MNVCCSVPTKLTVCVPYHDAAVFASNFSVYSVVKQFFFFVIFLKIALRSPKLASGGKEITDTIDQSKM